MKYVKTMLLVRVNNFGLKNTDTEFQQIMGNLFLSLSNVKCYVVYVFINQATEKTHLDI